MIGQESRDRGRRSWLDLVTCLVRGATSEEYIVILMHQQWWKSGRCAGISEGPWRGKEHPVPPSMERESEVQREEACPCRAGDGRT